MPLESNHQTPGIIVTPLKLTWMPKWCGKPRGAGSPPLNQAAVLGLEGHSDPAAAQPHRVGCTFPWVRSLLQALNILGHLVAWQS